MHNADITPELVSRLVASQFPEWADLPVTPVELDGWDNTTFRLGSRMSVRLPSHDAYVAQIDKEHYWLPRLANQLPLLIPEPLAKGTPTSGFPRPWSVYRWREGATATVDRVADLAIFASDLAAFLTALYRCDTDGGPPAGPHSFNRGGPLLALDAQARQALESLSGVIDTTSAAAVWDAALAANAQAAPVWVHGDVTGANLLVVHGRLSAVIDFGCSAVGDPACDTTIAWTFFSGESRSTFTSQLLIDEPTWTRGRGWALWKALIEVAADLTRPGHAARAATRVGWRHSAAQIISELIEDHRQTR